MTSRRQIQDGGPPRLPIQYGGPCSVTPRSVSQRPRPQEGSVTTGHVLERGVVLLYIQRVSTASHVSNEHGSGGVYMEDFLEGSV